MDEVDARKRLQDRLAQLAEEEGSAKPIARL
jgi:hypothetical protein